MIVQKPEIMPIGIADRIMRWIIDGTPEENKKYMDRLWERHEERVSKLTKQTHDKSNNNN